MEISGNTEWRGLEDLNGDEGSIEWRGGGALNGEEGEH